MSHWDSAAKSIYATSGFVMRVITPIALLLIIASVSGCCHRRTGHRIGYRACHQPVRQCEKCRPNPAVVKATNVAPQSEQGGELGHAVQTAPIAPQEVSTAPPLAAPTTDAALNTPVVGEISSGFSNVIESQPQPQPLPSPEASSRARTSGPSLDPDETTSMLEPSPTGGEAAAETQPARGLSPLQDPLAPAPATAPTAEFDNVPFDVIPQPDANSGFLQEPPQDESTSQSSEPNFRGRLTLGNADDSIAANLQLYNDNDNETPVALNTENSLGGRSFENSFTPDQTEPNFVLEVDSCPTLAIPLDAHERYIVPDEQTDVPNLNQAPVAAAIETSNGPADSYERSALRAATSVLSLRNARVTTPDGHGQGHDSTQRITESTKLDPVYGLPLGNRVAFAQLPKLTNTTSPHHSSASGHGTPAHVQASNGVQSHRVRFGKEDSHIHVHIHRGSKTQNQSSCDCRLCKADVRQDDVRVIYTDSDGRTTVAPPTSVFIAPAQPEAVDNLEAGRQLNDRSAYYLPPRQVLRLKASTDLNQPQPQPTVASIQMRDTLFVGGSHLLNQPADQATAENRHVRLEVEVIEIRDALKRLATEQQLR